MTQQQMSKLLDVPERTLRDWKKSRNRLYNLLENTDYNEAKNKINVYDLNDIVEFEPSQYSYNLFWQTNQKSEQKVYAIISNYLSTLNKSDIQILCKQYGKNMVKAVLIDKYKKIYAKGFISTNGIDIPIKGNYTQNEVFREIMEIINHDC